MNGTSVAAVEGFYKALRLRDVQAMMAYTHDDILIRGFHDRDDVPFGAPYQGKAEATRSMINLLREWDYPNFSTELLAANGPLVRVQWRVDMLHRPSGRPLDHVVSHHFVVRSGRIVEFQSRFDVERMASFLRLAEAEPILARS